MSQMVCKNCENEYEGNFCNNCGQKATVKRLTYESLADNLMHGFLHIDKGIFYTIKMLFINPGKVVLDFVNCKRARYFQPFPLLIILSTIFGLLNSLMSHTKENIEKIDLGGVEKPVEELINYFVHHIYQNYAVLNIFLIPPFVMAVRIAFRKANAKKYNLVEYFFGGAYLSSLYILISLIFLPISYLLTGSSSNEELDTLIWILYFIVTVRFLYELFEGAFWKTARRTFYTFCLYGLFFVFYVIILAFIAVGIAYAKEGILSMIHK